MNYVQKLEDLINLNIDGAGVMFGISLLYLVASIIIEFIHILFLFTPSKRDDALIEQLKAKWTVVSRYAAWFSVRTPASMALSKTLKMLGYIREDIGKVKTKDD